MDISCFVSPSITFTNKDLLGKFIDITSNQFGSSAVPLICGYLHYVQLWSVWYNPIWLPIAYYIFNDKLARFGLLIYLDIILNRKSIGSFITHVRFKWLILNNCCWSFFVWTPMTIVIGHVNIIKYPDELSNLGSF